MRSSISIYLLLALVFLAVPATSQTGVDVPELRVFDVKMSALLAKYKVAGGQMAVTYKGRLVYNRGFGLADTVDRSKVQPTSIFRIASVSKTLTSIAIMTLVERGLLKLDEKVFGASGILNDTMFQRAKDPRMYDITIRQLLTHTAGFRYVFPADPLFQTYTIAIEKGVPPPAASIEMVIQWALQTTDLYYSPGTSSSYTNFGYAVLGKVIEKVSGVRYEEYVRNTVLAPLKITEVRAGKNLKKDKLPNEVSYYDYEGAPLSTSIYTGISNSVPAQYGGYNFEIMTPAGGWLASAADLCRLLVAVDKFTTKPDILLSATLDTMTVPSARWSEYALGWFVDKTDYWHTGGIQGTASVIQRSATRELNWAVIFNALPANYGSFYQEFMAFVKDAAPTIATWPSHDLFDSQGTSANDTENEPFALYPNPAVEILHVENGEVLPLSLQLFSALGERVLVAEIRDCNTPVSIGALPRGMYVAKISTPTQTIVRLLLKE